MIILKKKRIIILFSLIVFTIAICEVKKINVINNKHKDNIVQVVSLPVSNKTVILDARTSEFLMKGHKVAMEQQKPKLI